MGPKDKFAAKRPEFRPVDLGPDEKHWIPKVGRNEHCPCGSGKKYKRCHGA
jgi:uncharacterized protein YecA (UPF0149 family)